MSLFPNKAATLSVCLHSHTHISWYVSKSVTFSHMGETAAKKVTHRE